MFVIIAGGGKVGGQLARDLLAGRHEVVVMESNPLKARSLQDEIGDAVVPHDASEGRWLIDAGIGRADVLIAVTGDDEDNIVICQLGAALSDGRARTITRINNPRNSDTFRTLGIEAIVNATDLVMTMIERDVSVAPVVHLMRLRSAGLELVEMTVAEGSAAAGSTPEELGLPEQGGRISVILRDGAAVLPLPSTRLLVGDSVILVAQTEFEEALGRQFAAPTIV